MWNWLLNLLAAREAVYSKDGTRKTELSRREKRISIAYFNAALRVGEGIDEMVAVGFPEDWDRLLERWRDTEKRYTELGFEALSVDFWTQVAWGTSDFPYEKDGKTWTGWTAKNSHHPDLWKPRAEGAFVVLHAEIYKRYMDGLQWSDFVSVGEPASAGIADEAKCWTTGTAILPQTQVFVDRWIKEQQGD